jgi:TatA/E family protein of Tat protein translocase
MFGSIGLPELVLIFVVALLLFGPRKLPDIGRSLGRALGEFRRASNDLKHTLEEEVAAEEIRDVSREVRGAVAEPPAASAAEAAKPGEEPPPSLEPR